MNRVDAKALTALGSRLAEMDREDLEGDLFCALCALSELHGTTETMELDTIEDRRARVAAELNALVRR